MYSRMQKADKVEKEKGRGRGRGRGRDLERLERRGERKRRGKIEREGLERGRRGERERQ